MPNTPRELHDHHAPRPRWAGRRYRDKLLTIDRALLTGIFLAGAWYATTDMRNGNALERVAAVEKKQEQIVERRGEEAVQHAAEIATIKQRLNEIDRRTENIEKGLGALAESTARLANAVRER